MNKIAPRTPDRPATINCELDAAPADDITREDVPPDGGYGWICVAACFTTNCFTWGAVSVSL
jgi:hypothetical protein